MDYNSIIKNYQIHKNIHESPKYAEQKKVYQWLPGMRGEGIGWEGPWRAVVVIEISEILNNQYLIVEVVMWRHTYIYIDIYPYISIYIYR